MSAELLLRRRHDLSSSAAAEPLSPPDRAILFLLARGESPDAVAHQLGISVGTVEATGAALARDLVLVPAESRATAVAALPEIELESFIPRRTTWPADVRAEVIGGVAAIVEIVVAASAAVVGLVLLLTLIADALR